VTPSVLKAKKAAGTKVTSSPKDIAATKIQSQLRALITRRENITGDGVKALIINPGRGEVPSFAASSKVVGKEALQQGGEIGNFNNERTFTRDAYRRVLETNVASKMLKSDHYKPQTESMQSTESNIKKWVDDALKEVDETLESFHSDDWVERSDNTAALLKGLYNDSPELKVTSENDQSAQFANGLAQAREEGSSDLAVSALRIGGLLQAVAWLAPTQDEHLTLEQNNLVRTLRDNYEGEHEFFGGGRGRVPVEESPSRNETKFKGIIKDERGPLGPEHRLSQAATRAQTTNEPSHNVPQKPSGGEENIPAWLTEATTRKMPFVNSVSGLGMLSGITDSLDLLPQSKSDKQDFYGLIAAAQLNFVGGHTFHEFLTGVEIGQNSLLQEEVRDSPPGGHGINFNECMERIPSAIYKQAAESMANNHPRPE
jgi:hypothetical protein